MCAAKADLSPSLTFELLWPLQVATPGTRLPPTRRISSFGGWLATDRQLHATIERVSSLGSDAIDGMFGLYTKYYDATSGAAFASDLGEKDFLVVLRDRDDEIAGFSTIAMVDTATDLGRIRAIYSGDTIIDRAHWGTQALAFTWLRFAGQVKAQEPECPLYWFLIVKGHRTYRYLSAFSIEFYPNWRTATPNWANTLMTGLARLRFAGAYDASCGVVSFPQSRGHLKPQWANVEPADCARPDVSFFLRRNPGYARGDELVCLTELTSANLRPIARRVFDQGLRE
jgi:hypothetical protein